MSAPRPWVTFDGTNLRFTEDGLTVDEIRAINGYIRMIYEAALRTGPEAGAINLMNLTTRDIELDLMELRELRAAK